MAQSARKSTRTKKAGNNRAQGTKAKTKSRKGQPGRSRQDTPNVAGQGQESLGVKSLLSYEDIGTLRQVFNATDQTNQTRRSQPTKTHTSGDQPGAKRPRHPEGKKSPGRDRRTITGADVIELKENDGKWTPEPFEIKSPTIDSVPPTPVDPPKEALPAPPDKEKKKEKSPPDIKVSPTSNDPLGRWAAGCTGLLVLIGILIVCAIDFGQKLEIEPRPEQNGVVSQPIMRGVLGADHSGIEKPRSTPIAAKKQSSERARPEEAVISIHRASPEVTPIPRTKPVIPTKPVYVSPTPTPPPTPTPLPFVVAFPHPDRPIYMPESVKRLARGRGWKPVVVTVRVLADGSSSVIDVVGPGSIPSFAISRLKEAVVSASWGAARDSQGQGVDAVTKVVFRFDGRRK